MRVDVCLVTLIGLGNHIEVVLNPDGSMPRQTVGPDESPHDCMHQLAQESAGTTAGLERQTFLEDGDPLPSDTDVVLVYRQLLNEEQLANNDEATQPLNLEGGNDGSTVLGALNGVHRPVDLDTDPLAKGLSPFDHQVLKLVTWEIRTALREVMFARENRRGLSYLLDLMPQIFERRELRAYYEALLGEKPPSAIVLAQMMLDSYQIGSGEKARVVRGRNLIEELDEAPEALVDNKYEKNRTLYRKGGPKARRFYRQKER